MSKSQSKAARFNSHEPTPWLRAKPSSPEVIEPAGGMGRGITAFRIALLEKL